MDNNVARASADEGKALADMYKGAGNLRDVDKQVHDRLLQDAIKSHHSELDMEIVKKSLVGESAQLKDKRVHITEEKFGSVSRTNESLPGLSLMDNGKLYDPVESWKAVQQDDKQREQAAKAKSSPDATVNFFDGGLGLPTLFKQITDATNKHS